MSRPRDMQRSRLYAWERANLRDRDDFLPLSMRIAMTEKYAQDFVDVMWPRYGRGVRPRVRIMGNRGRGCYKHHEHEIRLSSRYAATCCAWYVIHEIAHAIVAKARMGNEWADHGPEFAALYAHLLATIGDAPSEPDIRDSMRVAGLKVAPWKRIAWLDMRSGLAAGGDA